MTGVVSSSIFSRFGPRPRRRRRHDRQHRPPLPELDQARRLGAAASVGVQVVPGREQPRRRVGDGVWRMRGHAGVEAREGLREDRLDAVEPVDAIGGGPQHRRLHHVEEQRRVLSQCVEVELELEPAAALA